MGATFLKQTIRDVNLTGKTVLVRTDYNVPLTRQGKISDDLRIRASLPTLRYLLRQNCRIVTISHLGRPQGRDEQFSLKVVARALARLLGQEVGFVDDCVGEKVKKAVKSMPLGSVTLLENLRFYGEEEADDMTFAKALCRAVNADYFVQDGFGVVHRAHASTHAITLQLPSLAGLLVEKEYTTITKILDAPRSPFVSIIGGAKISDKIQLIRRLVAISDKVLIGGAMANNFLQYRGLSVGKSVIEPHQEQVIAEIYKAAERKVGRENVDNLIVLPSDVAVAADRDSLGGRREVLVGDIANDDMALDIGSQTIETFTKILASASMVVWNGPLGYTDNDIFAIGSARTALAIAQNQKCISVVGGGDTADFILKWDGHDGASFTHISTGGGASMELMSGKELPGIASLLDAHGHRVVH